MFNDRIDGAKKLAQRLHGYQKSPDAVIFGLPRGGVVVGFVLHQELELPLDVFVTRRLRAPRKRDLALGAVTETGSVYRDPDVFDVVRPSEEYVQQEIARENEEIERRRKLYRPDRDRTDVKGRTVLVVDDGIATGSSAIAAVHALRDLGAEKVVVAAPVASPSAVRKLDQAADMVVVVDEPVAFSSVSAHYGTFGEVSDEAVVRYLAGVRGQAPAQTRGGRASG